LVDKSRRRAASDALSNSVDIWTSFVESEFTAEDLDLVLDLREDREMVGIDQDVSAVLECRKEIERILQVIGDAVWGFRWRPLHP